VTRADIHATIRAVLPVGRANAISISHLSAFLPGQPASSTVRALIHEAQEAGVQVLSSPRVGVWLAAGDAEVLEVVEELRQTCHALERRMQVINGGRCGLISCRAELTDKVRKRKGLYCSPLHRYQAAALRASS